MTENNTGPTNNPNPVAFVSFLMIAIAVGVAAYFVFFNKPGDDPKEKWGKAPFQQKAAEKKQPPSAVPNARGKDGPVSQQALNDRKERYGLDKSMDMIVTRNESIRVGDQTVNMKDIVDKLALSRGEVVQESLGPGQEKGVDEEYGVYVVRKGDNIWDIHFNVLREYFQNKGVVLSASADEPTAGKSTGVARILKFSENMVYIYNVNTKKMESDLNLIEPSSKIVVYNMSDVFDLLDKIDYRQVDMIRFDGDSLWLPPPQSNSKG